MKANQALSPWVSNALPVCTIKEIRQATESGSEKVEIQKQDIQITRKVVDTTRRLQDLKPKLLELFQKGGK